MSKDYSSDRSDRHFSTDFAQYALPTCETLPTLELPINSFDVNLSLAGAFCRQLIIFFVGVRLAFKCGSFSC